MKLSELESVLLDQIEKLNDDSIAEDEVEAKTLVERSKAMSELAGKFIDMNRLKLDIVKVGSDNGGLYNKFLGIESDKGKI